MTGDTQIYDPVQPAQQETPTQPVQDDYDIHVKTMDVGQYNTINLQAELAAGLREVLGEEPKGDTAKATSDSITRSIVAPMMDSDTESLDYPEIAEVSEDDLEMCIRDRTLCASDPESSGGAGDPVPGMRSEGTCSQRRGTGIQFSGSLPEMRRYGKCADCGPGFSCAG